MRLKDGYSPGWSVTQCPVEIGIVAYLPGPTADDDRRRPVVEAGATQVVDRAIDPEAATVEIVVLEECQLSGGRHSRDESEAYNKYGDPHRVSFHYRSIGTHLCAIPCAFTIHVQGKYALLLYYLLMNSKYYARQT
jgi:hypothetical protein